MSTDNPEPLSIDGEGFRFAIVASRYNQELVDGLMQNVLQVLRNSGVDEEDIEIRRVPGAFETVYVARMLATTAAVDCVIVLGVILQGETNHADVLANTVTASLLRISELTEIPVINGIITATTVVQAKDRCVGNLNRGAEFAAAALEMAEYKIEFDRSLDDLAEEGLFDDENDDDFELEEEEDDNDFMGPNKPKWN